MAMLPMALYGLEVPAINVPIPARPDIAAAFRITMAAIDPTADPEGDGPDPPRATLKVLRQPLLEEFDEDSEDFDPEEMERMLAEDDSEEDDDDEEMINGGPSDPAKSKKAKREAARKEIQKLLMESDMDVEGEEEPSRVNGVVRSAKSKGKMPAGEVEDEDDEDDDEDDEDEEGEIDEFVICTLDVNRNCQQPIDITIGEDERVWFKVTGAYSVFLTGNYVEPASERSDLHHKNTDIEDEYDLEPDSDELDEADSSEDELDEMEDPRVTEIDEDEDDVPTLVKSSKVETKSTNKNKRPAAGFDDDEGPDTNAHTLDDLIAESSKGTEAGVVNGNQKLSKKQLKKLKKNDGAAGAAPVETNAEKVETGTSSPSKPDKKVSFAKELEQGPTPTKQSVKTSLGVKVVQGVTIDDKKLGSGQAAKSGDRVSMRYIGKLSKDGKVFDSNKKGKPFSFKLGSNEVIKGWDIGVAGMSAGGERRITVPAHLAYGSKSLPGIPPHSVLVFDVKMLDINKSK